MERKISLVLSGGGARGAFHLGVLHALDVANIQVMSISSASIGSIVGAGYISGVSPMEMLEVFLSKRFKKAIKFKPRNGIFEFNFHADILKELTPGIENIEDLPKPLYISITNITKGEVEYRNRGNIAKTIASSSAILPIFSPIEMDGYLYADGGYMDNFPTLPLKNSPYPLLGVNLHPNTDYKKQGLIENFKRGFFLCWHSGISKHMSECDFYLAPKELTNFPILRTSKIEELFNLGFKEAKNMIEHTF